MLAKPGTEERPPAFCSMKQPCTDGMLSFEERAVTMTLQEWKIWNTLLHMIPPVEIQGQSMAEIAQGVDLQALDGSCPQLSVWQLLSCKQRGLGRGQDHPLGPEFLAVVDTESLACLQ